MNFAQLKAFQTVANNGSITGAAHMLHVKSAVGFQTPQEFKRRITG